MLGLGAILYQVHESVEKVISYTSRSLTQSETKSPLHKLEFLYMYGYFSFCLVICKLDNFLKNRIFNLLKDKLLPDFPHGFFWSEENVHLNQFPTQYGIIVLVCP